MRINRHSAKFLCLLIIATVLIFTSSVMVSAELKSDILFSISETRNMAITVSYSKEVPQISFISPNGEKLYDGVSEKKMSVEYTQGTIYYLIPNAMPGDWIIEYDKLSNDTIDVTYAPYAETVKIESIIIDSISDGIANINFDVSYTENTSFNYIVSAAITDENLNATGQKVLYRGSGASNTTTSARIPLSSLSSHDNYHLMLEVYLTSGGIEVFDIMVLEESFSFENDRELAQINDFYTEIDLTADSLMIDWGDYSVRNSQEYIVAVYNSENLNEPMFYSTYEPDITSTELLIDTSVEFIRVELLYRKNDITSKALIKDIRFDTGTKLSISTATETNSAQAIIDYDSVADIPVIVTVNGNSETVSVSGKGYFSVAIEEFTNEVQVSYYPEQNVCFILKAEIYSDRTPPILLLYENTSAITTAASRYTLTGETEPGCMLKINDEIFAINEDGTFIHDLKISGGDNIFTIVASDTAGNSSMQTINIRKSNIMATGKGSFKTGSILPLIIAFVLSMILVICVFLFTRTYAKKVPEGRFKAVLSVIRNVFVVITPLAFGTSIFAFFMSRSAADIINSAGYYDLVQESVLKASEAISKYESINRFFIIACILFVTCLLITVLLSWILKSSSSSKKANAIEDI